MKLKVTTQAEQEAEDLEYMRSLTPEERLDLLETLRQEGGKFAYEYPSRLPRVITVTYRPPRAATLNIIDPPICTS